MDEFAREAFAKVEEIRGVMVLRVQWFEESRNARLVLDVGGARYEVNVTRDDAPRGG